MHTNKEGTLIPRMAVEWQNNKLPLHPKHKTTACTNYHLTHSIKFPIVHQ